MKTIDAVRKTGVSIGADATLHEAAVLMEQAGVGALAVLDGGALVGVVTDRDLACRGIARGLAADARVDSVMTSPVVSVTTDTDLHDLYSMFRDHGVRRLAVTRDGEFVSMIAIDDLLMDLATDLANLSRPVAGEVLFGHHDAPVPATR